jgi:hypothetical protein
LAISPTPHQNKLLAALASAVRKRLSSALEPVPLKLSALLYEDRAELSHVYFPTTAIVSLLCVMKNGNAVEVASVGNEGAVGTALLMGAQTLRTHAVVHIAGDAFRLNASIIKREFERGGTFQSLLLRYSHALINQMAQTSGCIRHHTVEQQLSRHLLLNAHRLATNTINLTHHLLADKLGVRREGITQAAGKLQNARVIRTSRGRITVVDRQKLKKHACECYGVFKKELDNALP